MDGEILGKWHSKRLKQGNHPEETPQRIEFIGLQEGQREVMKGPSNFTTDALWNFLVLQNIFRHLDGEDLERCKRVNRRWNDVLGQIYTRHYKVKIKGIEKDPDLESNEILPQNDVRIQKLLWSSKRSVTEKYTFPDALAILLDKSSEERKFAVDLTIDFPKYADDEEVKNFISKIGSLVYEFTPGPTKEFWDPLAHLVHCYFPNLCVLNLSNVSTRFFRHPWWEDWNDNLSEKKLKNLRKITFGESLGHFEMAESFIKVAEWFINIGPNLQEIHAFPVHLVNALISTGKSNLVKSITYPTSLLIGEQPDPDDVMEDGEILNGGPLEIAMKKFAQLKPKLKSFSFVVIDPSPNWDGDGIKYPTYFFHYESLQPLIRQIFQSSHQSLETLVMHPLCPTGQNFHSFDFHEIPPMTTLKKIEFVCAYRRGSFPSNMDLQIIFPNVSILEFYAFSSADIKKYFSPSLLSPWGSKIKELILVEVDMYYLDFAGYKVLSQLFPSLKRFKFPLRNKNVAMGLKLVLPLITNFWPGLEIITIDVYSSWNDDGSTQCSLDSVFTGISDEQLTNLMNPTERERFATKDIKSFYENSTIRKLPNLKRLEFNCLYYDSDDARKFLGRLYTITSLSKEFGFDFLPPDFKIIVRGCDAMNTFYAWKDAELRNPEEVLFGVASFEFEVINE